jgi:hypothetical protein
MTRRTSTMDDACMGINRTKSVPKEEKREVNSNLFLDLPFLLYRERLDGQSKQQL